MAGEQDELPRPPLLYGELRRYEDQLRALFRLPVPSAPGLEAKAEIRVAALELALVIARTGGTYSTEIACAMRRLREVVFWAEAAVDHSSEV